MRTKSDKQLLDVNIDTQVFNYVVASPDGQKLLYYLGVNVEELAELGPQGGPPYKIMEFNVTTGQSIQLATVGSLHEKDPDGELKVYDVAVGFTADSHQPYYTADNKLVVLDGTEVILAFEANKNFREVLYVSRDELFATIVDPMSGNNDDYYTLYRHETATKKLRRLSIKNIARPT